MIDGSVKVCPRPSGERFSAASGLVAALLLVLCAVPGRAETIFNSIPSPLPGNVASVGFEATTAGELGDGVIFTPDSGRLISEVKVVMSSWACTSGHWTNPFSTANVCVTTPGATFNQSLTLNIYAVTGTTPGPLLKTVTRTFAIPYLPSTDARCVKGGNPGGSGQQWYCAVDNTCYTGIAHIVSFAGLNLGVSQDRVIITVAYNTSHYGPVPIGTSPACYSTVQGCPYDSLNVSAEGSAILGANIDPNGIWANWGNAGSTCSGAGAVGSLLLDTGAGCWTTNHPQFQVNTADDVLQIRYMSNLTHGDGVVNITNTGASGNSLFGPGFGAPTDNLCVNAYVILAR